MNFNKVKQLAATTLNTVLPLEYMLKVSRRRYILAYHRVLPVNIAKDYNMQDSMWISVETFNDDIEWMKKNGDIVDLETILDFSVPNDRTMFSITFDDGWKDNYEYAFPILMRQNIPATIFLVTSAIETGHLFWVEDFLYKIALLRAEKSAEDINRVLLKHHSKLSDQPINIENTMQIAEKVAELIKPAPVQARAELLENIYHDLQIDPEPINDQILKWSDIIEMSKNGIEFGSHTHTHEILKYASDETITSELTVSKKLISDKTGKSVKYFCYPNARYRSDNEKHIEQAGYEYAFRIDNLYLNETENRYFIPRYLLNERVCRNKSYLLCRLLNIPKF